MKLETDRLILRKPEMSDLKDIFEGIKNLNVSKNLSGVHYPYKKEDAKKWIQRKIKSWNKREKKEYSFVIELKSEKKVIGCLAIENIDKVNGLCDTGSWLNVKYHRKGYMTEAKIAVNEFVFDNLNLRKMETGAFFENKASNKIQKYIGYKLEGCKRKHVICKATGEIHDLNIYGLFKSEWKKNLPKLKKDLYKKIKKWEIKK